MRLRRTLSQSAHNIHRGARRKEEPLRTARMNHREVWLVNGAELREPPTRKGSA
jgi:hypothetical protein